MQVAFGDGKDEPYLQSVETSGESNYKQYSSEVSISKEEFIERSKAIKDNIQNLESKIKEYNSLLQKNDEIQTQKETIIPKLENIIDLYDKLETAEDKNILLKSIFEKVSYLKTEKAIKKNSDQTNFELHIYPKIPRI